MELTGISDIEGKAAQGSGERVGKRVSFKSVQSVVEAAAWKFVSARRRDQRARRTHSPEYFNSCSFVSIRG
jgi:hypothetical protein